MSNYSLLSWKNTKDSLVSAFAPEGIKTGYELIQELDGVNELPFELQLIKLSDDKDGLVKSKDLNAVKQVWLDYQPNSLAWPLMSEKLKAVIEKSLTGNEDIDWIKVKVNGNGEIITYYILRFKRMLDVLDIQKTMFVQGTDRVIKPCFSLSKVINYSIFHQPSGFNLWKITSGLYVSEDLKKMILKEKLTGLDFEKTSVA